MICLACQFVFVSLNFTVGHGELPTRLPGDERERNCEMKKHLVVWGISFRMKSYPVTVCGDYVYVINHYKDPYETTSISWEVRVVFLCFFFREVGFAMKSWFP